MEGGEKMDIKIEIDNLNYKIKSLFIELNNDICVAESLMTSNESDYLRQKLEDINEKMNRCEELIKQKLLIQLLINTISSYADGSSENNS